MVIELGSHTDARGNDDYNQKLSQRRAASARRWLIKKGVAEDRIVAKGYGEEVILNNCTNGEECTDDEHRFNRRTEFKIIQGPTTIEVKKEVLNKKAKPKNKG
jgi:peptidoglycan-associated lipoprotein